MLLSESGRRLLTWIIVFTVITTLFLILRFWAARIQKRSLYLDDYFVLLAYVRPQVHYIENSDRSRAQASTLAFESTTIWAIINGLGAHATELSPEQLAVQFKVSW